MGPSSRQYSGSDVVVENPSARGAGMGGGDVSNACSREGVHGSSGAAHGARTRWTTYYRGTAEVVSLLCVICCGACEV